MKDIDETTRTELEAAAFRRLVEHLRERTDVQNIDLMNLAGFCRNCLSNWLKEAADERGVALSKDESRTHVYGMPYEEWKERHQREATPSQLADFEKIEAGALKRLQPNDHNTGANAINQGLHSWMTQLSTPNPSQPTS